MQPRERSPSRVRAESVKAAVDAAWTGERTVEREGKTLRFERKPEYVLNKRGEIIGLDVMVRLFDAGGKEIPIDPHRVVINPPTVPRANIRLDNSGTDDLGHAIIVRSVTPDSVTAWEEAIWDSVLAVPNPEGWKP